MIDLAVMVIRPFGAPDAPAVSALHNAIYADDQHTPASFRRYAAAGSVWMLVDDDVVGYAAVSSIPGLDGVYNLDGGILPAHRRRGLGDRLLRHVLRAAPALNIGQLSHCVTDPDSPAARFLRRRNFFIEHEEWLMALSPLPPCFPAPLSVDQIQTHPLPAPLFCQLYDQSFGGAPWCQPYRREEVEDRLDDPNDILFLFMNEQPIGFAWLQGEWIEPMGIVKEEWRQGYGRILLLAALQKLKQRGAVQARIGVWGSNQAAIRLYQSVGFQRQQTLTYLAYELATQIQTR